MDNQELISEMLRNDWERARKNRDRMAWHQIRDFIEGAQKALVYMLGNTDRESVDDLQMLWAVALHHEYHNSDWNIGA